MKLYDVEVSARYRVGADNMGMARVVALENMRHEVIECPENLGDFDTQITPCEE